MLHLPFEGWNLRRFIQIQNIHLCTRSNGLFSVKLCNKNNPEEIQNMYVIPDLTPRNRKKTKHCVANYVAGLNKSEKLCKIKNGKIVQRQDETFAQNINYSLLLMILPKPIALYHLLLQLWTVLILIPLSTMTVMHMMLQLYKELINSQLFV